MAGVLVPDLAVLSVKSARDHLVSAGLAVRFVSSSESPPRAELAFTVQSQSHAAGETVPRGTTLTLTVYGGE